MPIIDVRSNDVFYTLLKSHDGIKGLIIKWSASWCIPCHKIQPEYIKLAEKYSKWVYLEVDIDECSDISDTYLVSSLPSFTALYPNGQQILIETGDKLRRVQTIVQ
jgi:thiol-disulfide isomerase/thioredoxin